MKENKIGADVHGDEELTRDRAAAPGVKAWMDPDPRNTHSFLPHASV